MAVFHHLLSLALVVALAVIAYPLERDLAGIPHDTRVAQMQLAHAVMLITAAGFAWPRRDDSRRVLAWFGFAAASSVVLLVLVPFVISPPMMFLCSAVAGVVAALGVRS